MKINEITLETVKNYLRIDHDFDDVLIQIFMDAAKAHIISYTGLSESEVVDEFEGADDLSVAYLVIVSDMYDNRQVSQDNVTSSRTNVLLSQILGKYSRNLL